MVKREDGCEGDTQQLVKMATNRSEKNGLQLSHATIVEAIMPSYRRHIGHSKEQCKSIKFVTEKILHRNVKSVPRWNIVKDKKKLSPISEVPNPRLRAKNYSLMQWERNARMATFKIKRKKTLWMKNSSNLLNRDTSWVHGLSDWEKPEDKIWGKSLKKCMSLSPDLEKKKRKTLTNFAMSPHPGSIAASKMILNPSVKKCYSPDISKRFRTNLT